jgi:hypothetical protein
MYYFRDCYFDRQVAFGMTRSSLDHPRRNPAASRRTQGKPMDLVLPFVFVGVTFYTGVMVLDVLGLEHLVKTPSFELADAYVEIARSFVENAASKIPSLVTG